ncbi:hypothetical protein NP233_g6647 [Leucocoprinus birnbaumii]|uniref:Uncharacterized protein n=1 Tax=Leucocoprinus birnbaumii TaxID=56174 RepID=A0AAD5VW88_9AGAR|nr:hypothetical protein NP233_g6647 [Leucocoprinus birnbaumii]
MAFASQPLAALAPHNIAKQPNLSEARAQRAAGFKRFSDMTEPFQTPSQSLSPEAALAGRTMLYKSGEPVDDKDAKGRYEKEILAHAGVRLIEPELFCGYDPNKKVFNQEIELIHDLEPIEVSDTEAQKFKLQHGDKCDVWAGEDGQWFAKLKKGACVYVPKAFKFSRTVAGQIPTGWHAGRYGIPEDIIAQTDRVTLWARYMHPSEVGTSLGSGMGGVTSMAKMFKDRRDEREVQNDILQETFINTTAGWINLLLMSSSGPVKIPVGACATALQSIEIACDTILSGKAKVMIAGGFDDISEEGSYEFANMKATSNAEAEFAMGREPTEMSRPATTSRAGFMEAQGAGVHIVMSAKTTLEIGAPIRGVLAFTSTSTDKAGRSVPAPGKGALTVARQVPSKHPLPILDVAYRSRQLAFRRTQISQWLDHEHSELQAEVAFRKEQGENVDADYIASRIANFEKEAARQEKDALAMYVRSNNPTFISRNFTDAEVAYCRAQPSPASSFAARWACKEAVFKSLGVKSSGAAAPLKDIEILNNTDGVPSVHLHGEAKQKAEEKGIAQVLISLSHSETVAIAFAQATAISEVLISAVAVTKENLGTDAIFKDIEWSTYQVAVTNPEILMENSELHKLWDKSSFTKHILAFVFDEGHCITQWGKFRKHYLAFGIL